MQAEQLQIIGASAGWGLGLSILGLGIAALRKSSLRRNPELIQFLSGAADTRDFSATLHQALERFMADVSADIGYIRLLDPHNPDLLRVVASKSRGAVVPEIGEVTPATTGISGLSLSQRQTMLVSGNRRGSLVSEEFTELPSSALAIPISVQEATQAGESGSKTTVGVIVLATKSKSKPIHKSSLAIARAYGEVISMLVHARHLHEFSRETILDSLQEIADLLDSKDPFTVGHSRRTAEVARSIAIKMGLDEQASHEIWSAAKLIDLGKVAVPDSILRKNSGLSEDEFEHVKRHPLVSYDICRKLRLSESVLLIVRNHHERLDGSGYPDQLRGGELPLALRIVAAADAYDAMRCARPHRPGLSADEALRQLVQESGTKHDESVVEAIRVLTEANELEHLYEIEDCGSRILRVA